MGSNPSAGGDRNTACTPSPRHFDYARAIAGRHATASVPVTAIDIGSSSHRGASAECWHPGVRAWLAKNPRITLHFTPTSASWLSMVEIFFGIITRQAIRHGTFTSVKDLTAAIGAFIDGWNDRCDPFTWTETAGELLPHCKPGKRTSFTH